LVGLVALTVLVWARPADAHAAFVSSSPEAGSQLTTAPGVVVVRFSEPLIRRLSSATVLAPDGRRFLGTSAEREVRVAVTTNTPGVYEVRWRTVSPLDGHALAGSFRFGVGVAPGPGSEGATTTGPARSDLLLALGRWAEYAALLGAVGIFAVARLAQRPPALPWARPRLIVALAAALAAGVVVVVGEARLAASDLDGGLVYLSGPQGVVRLIRLGLEAVAVGAAAFGRCRPAAAAGAAAVTTLAASGHAAAVEPWWWGVAVDAGHLLGAGVWAGGVVALATLRPPGGWRSEAGGAMLFRFSGIAVPAFLVTVALGVLRGAQELVGVADLARTDYGGVLLLKVVAVAAMVPLSVLAWQRRAARPRVEAGVAAIVIGFAALLAAYPLPPQRAAEAEESERVDATGAALPRGGDLTLGGSAGSVLVGLTVRPGRPGPNQLLVHLVPVNGEEAAASVGVELLVDGDVRPIERCGAPCRRADVRLAGRERIEVRVGSPAGGRAGFSLPELPAPDGTTLLERATTRMRALRTYRIEELLGPADPPARSEWTLQAPDRLRFVMEQGPATVRIGTTSYTRPAPAAPWEVVRDGPPVTVPVVIWDEPGAVGVHVLGTEAHEGRETTVVAFSLRADSDSPIWFRLWVDGDGLVHRAEMRVKGHFMDHTYSAFDQPLPVEAPTLSGGAGR
jgi:copper transport protein